MNHAVRRRVVSQGRLSDLADCPIRPLTKTEARGIAGELRELAKSREGLRALLAHEPLSAFLQAALSLSPFLRDMATCHPEMLERVIDADIVPHMTKLIADARSAWKGDDGEPSSEAALMARLRQVKREGAFLLALADLARLITPEETTRLLSRLACACLSAAIDHLLLSLNDSGKIAVVDAADPSRGSGLIVLGMGKLGADELNYSSDIDVVVFFEPSAGIVADPLEASDIFAKMVRRLIRIMQERTGDGYVFRTDLRLRPDPGSTPLAMPVEAALNYYEARGQNWERAAYIKARPVAGDLEAGAAFCQDLVPFVFRKYLDFAAIADIHSIKRQIHAHRGFGEIAVKGHNVKLGRGGIREIEFFVQTQQLIAGGRMPELRGRRTDAMLEALRDASWLDTDTVTRLTSAYWFLRDVEHRIQMVRDEQSHTLPETDGELKRIALMAGFADVKTFSAAFTEQLKTVERYYSQLFEQETHLSGEGGNLVFTGESDDPDTLQTLRRLGFERPADMSKIIRTWHYGRYRATQSAEARERLTELAPLLLSVFGKTKRADEALIRFDSFLAGLPSGIQLFSLLGNNPGLLSLTVAIMSSAPRLADIIARKPHVFDGMLDPSLLAELPTRAYLAERLDTFLIDTEAYEDVLDRLRIFAAEKRFLIGVRLLSGTISGMRTGRALTDLADLILERTLAAVLAEMEQAHGRVAGGRAALVGMGKLGSFEMTAGSDVDMILVYDHDDDASDSDGARPLDPARYYARVTQRLIAALSAPTAEGVLYEVDLRLRPSGNKGPVATRFGSFSRYQHEEAWTWEHMALSRARCVAGDAELCGRIEGLFSAVLARPRDTAAIAGDVADMRKLMDQEKPPRDAWDVKLLPGGLVDIEFIAQFLALTVETGDGDRITHTGDVLRRLGPGVLDEDQLETLLGALSLQTELTQIMRLCLEGDFDVANAPAGLVDLICRAAELPDIRAVQADLASRTKAVRRIFNQLLSVKNSKPVK
jgi:[glutamine synthetase] adenylyltransferase / [glutamine synthetase]-adenylyl-L-tyrosine phosphorylase